MRKPTIEKRIINRDKSDHISKNLTKAYRLTDGINLKRTNKIKTKKTGGVREDPTLDTM